MAERGAETRACLLVRAHPRAEGDALARLSEWQGVRRAFLTYGRFSLVADLEVPGLEDIGSLALKASLLPGVSSTETLLGYGPRTTPAGGAGAPGAARRRALCLILAAAARIPALLDELRALPCVSNAYMLLGASDLAAFLEAAPQDMGDAIRAVRGLDGVVFVESLVEPD